MVESNLKNGCLIISTASILNDENFNRSVIFLAEHNLNGSLGFILNRNLNFKLKDLIPDTSSNFKVYYGGPVEPENLYFVHNVPEMITNSIEISHGIYWGGDFNKIISLLNENKLKASNIRFFLGYTGWDKEQLNFEIETNSWLIKENIFKNNLLKKTPSNLWKELMKTFGDQHIIWCNAPENPIFN